MTSHRRFGARVVGALHGGVVRRVLGPSLRRWFGPSPDVALRLALALTLAVATAPRGLFAQHAHESTSADLGAAEPVGVGGRGGVAGAPGVPGAPIEMGQGAFAALAEVVALLVADPATDWAKVDIEALRQHLIDMHEVVLHATIEAADTEHGARFTIGGPERTRAALHRMIPAHAMALGDEGRERWSFGPADGEGMQVTIEVREPGDLEGVARIRALGFVGALVGGMHHGPHHLAIARGMDPHAGHAMHH